MSKYAIEVKNIKKSFYLPHHKNDSLKSAITQVFKAREKGGKTFDALRDVSFNVEKGDFFGILGRNGSGKSTLLKIISDIYRPTKGSVRHDGKLVSFIELGVGFKAELTGRENVFLNGALLGFSKDEVAAMYDDIVSFAELEEFMEQKLKNYSSGMKVRLAFSVAIRARADILILDEVLAVGDAAFQRKCNDYFKTLKDDGKTVILVTHSMGAVREYCNKAVVVESGKIIFQGDADGAADKYLDLFKERKKDTGSDQEDGVVSDVELQGVSVLQTGKVAKKIKFKSDFSVEIKVKASKAYDNVAMGMYFYDNRDRSIVVFSSKAYGKMVLNKGVNTIVFDIQNVFANGDYYINFAIEDAVTKKLLVQKHNISPFAVDSSGTEGYSRHSLVYPDIKVRRE